MTNKPKSWRDLLPIHPAAELFPPMAPDELRALGEDIREHGIRIPIAVWSPLDERDKCEFLLDGRNRLDAAEVAGLLVIDDQCQLCLRTSDGPRRINKQYYQKRPGQLYDGDPYRLAISLNINRRHLTAEQKRELIAKLIKATPDRSDCQIAERTKASPTTVGKVRRDLEQTGGVSKVDTRTDRDGRKQRAHKPPKPTKDPHVAAAADRAEQRAPIEEAKRQRLAAAGNDRDQQVLDEPRDVIGEWFEEYWQGHPNGRKDVASRAFFCGVMRYAARHDAKTRRKPEGTDTSLPPYSALVDAWFKASPDDQRRFRERYIEHREPAGDAAPEAPDPPAADDGSIPDFLRREPAP